MLLFLAASQMDWESTEKSQSEADQTSIGSSATSDDNDADDEQSDWPDYQPDDDEPTTSKNFKKRGFIDVDGPSALGPPPVKVAKFVKPTIRTRPRDANNNIPPALKRRIDKFLADASQLEFSISQNYRVTTVSSLVFCKFFSFSEKSYHFYATESLIM